MCDLLYKFGSVVLAMHARPVCFDMLSAFNRHNHLNKVNQHLLKHVVFDELNRQSSLCVIMYAAEAMLRFWSCDWYSSSNWSCCNSLTFLVNNSQHVVNSQSLCYQHTVNIRSILLQRKRISCFFTLTCLGIPVFMIFLWQLVEQLVGFRLKVDEVSCKQILGQSPYTVNTGSMQSRQYQ